MKKEKSIVTLLFESLISLFANVFLWFLIWGGAVIALNSADEPFLALLLIIAGIAKIYQEFKRTKNDLKKTK